MDWWACIDVKPKKGLSCTTGQNKYMYLTHCYCILYHMYRPKFMIDGGWFVLFSFKYHKVKDEEDRIILNVIWLTAIWNIWLMGNTVMFKGSIPNFKEYWSNIKFKAWEWLQVSFNSKSSCNFYDWYNSPLFCFKFFSWFGFVVRVSSNLYTLFFCSKVS